MGEWVVMVLEDGEGEGMLYDVYIVYECIFM